MGLGEESNHRMARKPVLEFSKQSMGARNRVLIGLSYLPANYSAWLNWFLVIDSWVPQKFRLRMGRFRRFENIFFPKRFS
jgi:hypothetical protein